MTPMTAMPSKPPKDVAAVLSEAPRLARTRLGTLRRWIYETAAADSEIGELQETLKWGEPAYLTRKGRGTTLRIAYKPKAPDKVFVFVHCQTTLIEAFRVSHGKSLSFEGNRAVVVEVDEALPENALRAFFRAALRYHLDG